MIIFTIIGIITCVLLYFMMGFFTLMEEITPDFYWLKQRHTLYDKFFNYRLLRQCKKYPLNYMYKDGYFWYSKSGKLNEHSTRIDDIYTDIYIELLEHTIILLWPIIILIESFRFFMKI